MEHGHLIRGADVAMAMEKPARRTPARRSAPRAWVAVAALVFVACGSRTGLRLPDVVASSDAAIEPEAGLDVPVHDHVVERCFPERVRARVGTRTRIFPDADDVAIGTYVWRLRARPAGSSAEIQSDGTYSATITPDVSGEYDVIVEVPSPSADGGAIECSILVIAEDDPRCPGYTIIEPRAFTIPGTDLQVAFDIAWGIPRTLATTNAGAIIADDPRAHVAALVLDRESDALWSTPTRALATEGFRVEAALQREYGASPVLVGRSSATHFGRPLRRTTLRTGLAGDPGTMRDRALATLAGLSLPPSTTHEHAQGFFIDVVTMLRPESHHVVTIVTIAPAERVDDPRQPTAIRANDLANGTGITYVGTPFAVACQDFTAMHAQMADFLWLVDTSGSMIDDQERLGDTAQQFFHDMNNAGVEFRVGVMEAGSEPPILEGTRYSHGPFAWIAGNDSNGAQWMAFQVTAEAYRDDYNDRYSPFPLDSSGESEQPIAAAVLSLEEFERRRMIGERNPHFTLREGAAHAVFFVTDEPGDNDVDRFFSGSRARWGSDAPSLVASITDFFARRNVLTYGLVPWDASAPCPSVRNLHACVINEGNGAFIPIEQSVPNDANGVVASAMRRVVEDVIAASSDYVLPHTPVSATLWARADGRVAPRSRVDGFDYYERNRALVFRGPTFRAHAGQNVSVAYCHWQTP